MNTSMRTLAISTAIVCLSAPAAMAHSNDGDSDYSHHHHHGIIVDGGHNIHVVNGDVVITADKGEARITGKGELYVNGKSVPVTDQQKVELLQYSSSVKDLETHAMQLGLNAAGFAAGIVGEVIADLFSGEDEDQIDKDAHARANEFKKNALPLCNDVRSIKKLQDKLAIDIPSFKPFAVVEGKDADDCEQDINSDD